MADNTTLNTGTGGDTIATDDIAGVKHQRVKVQYGVDGAATDVSDTNPLPVDDAGGSLTVDGPLTDTELRATAVPVSGTVTADAGTGPWPVTDNGGSLTVDGTVAVTGVSTAANQTTVIGHLDGVEGLLTTIDADTGTIAGAVSGTEMQVDVLTMPTTTVADGGGSLTVDNAALSVTGTGTESGALRVTVASDSTGVLSVDDNGGSLTVDNATISVVGGGTEATAQRVTIANDSTGVLSVDDNGSSLTVDNGGTFVTQINGAALTALELIDNPVQVDDGNGFTVGSSSVSMAGFLADQASTDSVNEGDAGAARMTLDRKQVVTVAPSADTEGLSIFRSLDLDETEEDVKTSAGKLYGYFFYNDGSAEVYVKLYNATAANVTVGSTTPVITIPVPAGSGANVEYTNGIAFSTAICAAATTGVADADTTAPAANQVIANIFYQ